MKKSFLFIVVLTTLFFCSEKRPATKISQTQNAFYLKAREFRDKKISDSAFYYYNLAKDEYLKINDSIGAAESLINMAIIQTYYGDFYGSIESSSEANTFLKDEKDSITRRDLSSSYNNMGIASAFLYNQDSAITFYQYALKYNDDDDKKYIYYNNLGNALISQKNFKLAQKYLNYAVLSKNHENRARAINNLARAKFTADNNYNPLPEYYAALEIREKDNNLDGLNSSYGTLADYFFSKDKEKSLIYAKKMLQTATTINNPEDQLQALQKIIIIDKNNYNKYFEKFQSINDSIQISRNKAKNQFAYFRYGLEKEKAENQTLKYQKAEKEVQLLQRNIGLGALSLLLIGGFVYYKRRKKRLQRENELKIKENELKMSKKVHDVVANGIYQVMTKIENQENFNKDKALDELEFVYEKSRDISYEKTDIGDTVEFAEKIFNLISSFTSDHVKPFLTGNSQNLWDDVSGAVQSEIFQIIRELLVNMKKHSQASLVVFKFERKNNLIHIQYKDNGIGIPENIIHGKGLSNTVSRIEKIEGTIIFDNKTEKGLKINISFPTS
ncbi:tetratricopeptide repeat-containing sensor histidine kinase [Chryseobacterium sp. BIGb0232]|uniref:tetratricopeptide repeat-containing sensor histidine kinase n=1 Tax=Chryseobacterium sp. BIGb0232 TaxID=2940598 RepID=UPI000F46BFF4|nr:tetratricopeptide repeat-containing sensor histidine kinase [Chryseobacterium sp. BIGb0232]MCS4304242.1 tetratricopeptide (TPR) repeat protein [Chryseobacterium sp. BIGb0232]ROS14127.1 histidine kinase/DNA gyrase B/HSP90-like ATPase [Chryseobacterium nakagawai]